MARSEPQRPAGLPADDHPRENVEDERHIHPPRVRLDVGEVGDPEAVGGRCSEAVLDEVCRALEALVVLVVRIQLRLRRAPEMPRSRMRRSTVQRATRVPWRFSWAQTLSAP